MLLVVEVRLEGDQRPPPGAPVIIEVRDTSVANAASRTLASATGEVHGRLGDWLATVELDVPGLASQNTVWAHIDVNRDGRVSPGDFITTAAYPVPLDVSKTLTIRVRKV